MVRVFGYLRVSTADQDNEKFEIEILKYANANNLGNVRFIEEKISGTKDWKKRRLGELISDCKDGDCIIVPELSRLSRTVCQIYEIISECQKKGIVLHVLKQNLVLKNSNDLTTKVMLSTFSLIAELEREFISIRTKEALHSKRCNGVRLGRPHTEMGKSKLDAHASEVIALHKSGASYKSIGKKFGCTNVTVSSWIHKHCRKEDV